MKTEILTAHLYRNMSSDFIRLWVLHSRVQSVGWMAR